MVGRPIFDEISKEAIDLLRKAQNLEQKKTDKKENKKNYKKNFKKRKYFKKSK